MRTSKGGESRTERKSSRESRGNEVRPGSEQEGRKQSCERGDERSEARAERSAEAEMSAKERKIGGA